MQPQPLHTMKNMMNNAELKHTVIPASTHEVPEDNQALNALPMPEPKVLEDALQIDTPAGMDAHYQFIRELGSGAQGKVFLAKRRADGKQVAIKQLRIDSIKTWKEYTLFHREAEVLATLDIPGVVKFYEACDCLDTEPPSSYIVQEYIEGQTLKDVLKSGYRFSLAQTYELVLQLTEILKQLHAHDPQVIHRDIKPSNIILQRNGNDKFQICLLDFGAVSNPQVQSGGSTIAGTFGYMSPEQNIGRAVPASDTYAVAALMAYMLSGVDPADMTIKDLRLIIDPYLESQPRALVQMLRQMLEPNLDTRLSDIDKIQSRIQDFKNNRYILDTSQDITLSPAQVKKNLQDVHHLCQQNNIELWQAIPDNPDKRPELKHCFVTQPRFKDYPVASPSKTDPDQDRFFGLFCALIGGLIVFALGASISIAGAIFLGVASATLIFFIASSLSAGIAYHKSPKLNSIRETHHKTAEVSPEHQQIYRKGLKTIATITNITYIKCNQDDINLFSSYKHPRIETPPTFKITYKFNPPDDDTADDIFHSIHTHINPENRIKVGDPLPILYLTEPGPRGTHVTKSMPFPFPLHDLENPLDYLKVN